MITTHDSQECADVFEFCKFLLLIYKEFLKNVEISEFTT